MKKTFTLNDLLQYHYDELPSFQQQAIEYQLENDESFREESREVLKMKQLLNSEKKKPSASSIRLIMDYNRQNSSELEAC